MSSPPAVLFIIGHCEPIIIPESVLFTKNGWTCASLRVRSQIRIHILCHKICEEFSKYMTQSMVFQHLVYHTSELPILQKVVLGTFVLYPVCTQFLQFHGCTLYLLVMWISLFLPCFSLIIHIPHNCKNVKSLFSCFFVYIQVYSPL